MIEYDYDRKTGIATLARMSLAEWLALPIDSRRGTVAGGTAAMVVFRPPGHTLRIPVTIVPAAAAPARRKRPEHLNR